MEATKDQSSLPILLAITGAVLVVAGGGWLWLGSGAGEPVAATEPPAMSSLAGTDFPAAESKGPSVQTSLTAAVQTDTDVDTNLRKARLAAEAEILVTPRTASALYYYGQVLKEDPGNSVADAELQAVLSRVERTVLAELDAENYTDAYETAAFVAGYRPEHPLVTVTQETLDSLTEDYVDQAMDSVRAGNDAAADTALANAAGLPGRNPDYIDAVRNSIAEIRQARVRAEEDRTARAKLAAEEARAAWADAVRDAISAGSLVSPAGASAIDLLAESNDYDAERATLTDELRAALESSILANLDAENLRDAERLLAGGTGILDRDTVERFEAVLEAEQIRVQSNRVINAAKLTAVRRDSPRYPNSAIKRSLSGWVEVIFTVTRNGDTTDVTVYRAEPEGVFDNAAIKAVSKWQFEPYEFRGQVIDQRAAAKLVFNLETSSEDDVRR